jgi:hypothetical protein
VIGARYLDVVVLRAIEKHFPGFEVPDEANHRPNGTKYPAPDHYLPTLNVFIERKTMNPIPKPVWDKVNSIRGSNGMGSVRAYGLISSRQLFAEAESPEKAMGKLNDYVTNQLRKTLRSVEKKFSSFFRETQRLGLPILIVSDSQPQNKDSGLFEFTIAKYMQGQTGDELSGRIAATLWIALPNSTHNSVDGHWAKLVIRSRLSNEERQKIDSVVYSVLSTIEQQLFADNLLTKKNNWRFRPLIV